jgi:hypothetical protein
MTPKDYVALAAALMQARAEIKAKEPDECQRDLLDGVGYAAEFIADALASDNARFDRVRFMIAAGNKED